MQDEKGRDLGWQTRGDIFGEKRIGFTIKMMKKILCWLSWFLNEGAFHAAVTG